MTETTFKILKGAILTFIAAVFVFFLTFFLNRKDSVIEAVFDAVCVTICVITLTILLIFIGLRLFTEEGREVSRKAKHTVYYKDEWYSDWEDYEKYVDKDLYKHRRKGSALNRDYERSAGCDYGDGSYY